MVVEGSIGVYRGWGQDGGADIIKICGKTQIGVRMQENLYVQKPGETIYWVSQKKFWQHDTLGENLRGLGGGGGGVFVSHTSPHHHPTPDTQTDT